MINTSHYEALHSGLRPESDEYGFWRFTTDPFNREPEHQFSGTYAKAKESLVKRFGESAIIYLMG